MKLSKNKNHIRGAGAILLVALISAVIILIALGSASLMSRQIKASKEIGNSVVAYYAADAGAERCIFEYMADRTCNNLSSNTELGWPSGITYSISQTGSRANSIGTYQGTNRAVELSW